jgi:hypothetical protein
MIGVAVVAGVAAMPLPSSATGELPGFRAVALAEGGRMTFSVPGFAVVEDIIDGGGPVSQAVVDGQGASSFASLPYPGETALAFPGLFTAVTSQSLPAGYPFFVSASHPTTPEAQLKDPGGVYELTAQAAAGTAHGLAQLKGSGGEGQTGGSGGAQATTSVKVEGDTINVVAETVNEALNLGAGALSIASVRSRSVSTYRAGEPNPTTQTQLAIEGAAAGDTKFGYGPDGLVVAGAGVPIPAGNGLAALNQALAPAGLSIRFLEPQTLVGGATAGTLEVTAAQKSPASGVPGGTVRIRFGGATAAVTLGEALPADGGLISDPGFDLGDGPSAAEAPVQAPGAAVSENSPVLAGDALSAGDSGSFASALSGSGGFDSSSGASFASGALTSGSSAGTLSDPAAGLPLAASSQPILAPRRIGSDGFVFGSVIIAGLLMMVLSSLWRAKGVLS